MIEVNGKDLSVLVARARSAARRRQNLNIHQHADDPINRLLNAVEPGSYVRPHRHSDKLETLLAVAGSFELIFFDDAHRLLNRATLGGSGATLIEYPANTWHSLIALQTGSIFFEVKAGPYEPLRAEDYLPGWPAEHSADVPRAFEWLKNARSGERYEVTPTIS
jgi:cupin fold WbuC family metalloprotein